VRGLQGAQLHHQEEPAERSRPARGEEVLPQVQQAHGAQGNPLELEDESWPSTPTSSDGHIHRLSRTSSVGRKCGSSPTRSG